MKDIVSFDTAKRLKEAGFPQPAPAPGQFWYNSECVIFYIYAANKNIISKQDMHSGAFFDDVPMDDSDIYVPTRKQILKLIPFDIGRKNAANAWLSINAK